MSGGSHHREQARSRPGTLGGVPEGDTVWLAAQRMNTALAGATLRRGEFRLPQLADRRPDRRHRPRGRPPRQAPAHPAGRRAHAAHPLPDGRQLAHLPAGHEVARRPGLRRPRGAGHRRLGVRRLPAARHRDRADRRRGPAGRPPRARRPRPGLGPRRGAAPAARAPRRADRRRASSTSATWPASATSTRSSRCSSAASTRGPGWPTSPTSTAAGRAGPHADAGQPRPPRAEHHRRSAPRPGPLGRSAARASPCLRCGTPILLGEQGPPTQERVTWWCPTCQAARSPIDPQARTGEPGRPQPVTLYR